MTAHSSTARRGSPATGGHSLLPKPGGPEIVTATAARRGELDAVLAIVPESAAGDAFKDLPEAERWQDLHTRGPARSGTVRVTVLANRRQTLAVLGYVKTDASNFERLSLAGRMLKEASARTPQTLGLSVPVADSATAGMPVAAAQATLDALLSAALAQAFSMPSYREPSRDEHHINRITLLDETDIDTGYATACANGTNLARWLTALPPNILDARGYTKAITELAREHGLTMEWLDEQALRRAGANAFLAVSAANEQPVAGIAHLKYRPARQTRRAADRGAKSRGSANSHKSSPTAARRADASPDIALVGKGILFDTGGINLKTHRSMLDMHTDMSGSAVALATLIALAELRAPIAADAWLAITENRIGPNAYRPQEVVRAANGVTIQVIHTDAEGRMVLADTLALAARARPRFILDFATLTGACVYALTERMSGVFTNHQPLVETLVRAGRESGERVWNFPFDSDYDSDLESKVADVLQCAVDGKGDHILATRFLSRFVPEDISWAHVDLSSSTRTGGLGHVNTEVTGFGVRYALELILKQKILDAVGEKRS